MSRVSSKFSVLASLSKLLEHELIESGFYGTFLRSTVQKRCKVLFYVKNVG